MYNYSPYIHKIIREKNKMPTINKMPRKKRVYYKTYTWKKENQEYYRMNRPNREVYIHNHPLCELNLLEDRIIPMEELHHIVPISTAQTPEEKIWLATNPDNFISLSKDMHVKVHNQFNILTKKQQDYIRNKYNKVEAELNLYRYNDNNIEFRQSDK